MLETSIVAMNTYWLLPGTTEQPLFVGKKTLPVLMCREQTINQKSIVYIFPILYAKTFFFSGNGKPAKCKTGWKWEVSASQMRLLQPFLHGLFHHLEQLGDKPVPNHCPYTKTVRWTTSPQPSPRTWGSTAFPEWFHTIEGKSWTLTGRPPPWPDITNTWEIPCLITPTWQISHGEALSTTKDKIVSNKVG